MQPFVTVIVPIYNTEEYLPRCIESIQGQTYSHMEIILLDDGSTDQSANICEAYAKKDSRIRVIHQSNQGIIAAKKTALRDSHGKYVMIVDSDDWIDRQQLEALVNPMLEHDCSLVCAKVFVDRKDSTSVQGSHIPAGVYETGKIARDLFYYRDTDEYGILQYSVAKLYERSLLTEVLDHMDSRIRYGEDRAIVFGCVYQDIRVCFIEESYYHYCIRGDSVYQSENPNHLIEMTYFYQQLKRIFERHAEKEYLYRQLGYYLTLHMKNAVGQKLGLTSPDDPICRRSYELDPSIFCEGRKELVLYGAGKVGEDYWRKLRGSDKLHLCGWVDKNFVLAQDKGLDVQPVEALNSMQYDYILVAIKKEPVFLEIKAELLQRGVREEKIIWGKPLRVSYL